VRTSNPTSTSCYSFIVIKWLILNEGTAYKKKINCTNITELRNIGIYLNKNKCKWENKIKNLSSELGSGE
jgi:hypothetical protein